jgi:hypothetical protein
MLVTGLYALITGKVKLTRGLQLQGWQARVAGLFLMLPLPLAFGTGILVGFFMASGALPSSVQNYILLGELFLVLFGLAGAVIVGLVFRPEVEPISEEDVPAT